MMGRGIILAYAKRCLLSAIHPTSRPLTRHDTLIHDVGKHTQQDGDGDRNPYNKSDVHWYRIDEFWHSGVCCRRRSSSGRKEQCSGGTDDLIDHLPDWYWQWTMGVCRRACSYGARRGACDGWCRRRTSLSRSCCLIINSDGRCCDRLYVWRSRGTVFVIVIAWQTQRSVAWRIPAVAVLEPSESTTLHIKLQL